MRAARSGSVSIEIASRATASGVNASWIELGGDRLAGNQVHHPDGVERDDAARELVRKRRHPIDHDHRRVVKRRLDRGGARSGQRDIRRCQHGVGIALDEREPRIRAGRTDRVEQAVVEVRRARDDELRGRNGAPDQPRGCGEIGQDARHFVRTAAWQDGDRRAPMASARDRRETHLASPSAWPDRSAGARRIRPARRPVW